MEIGQIVLIPMKKCTDLMKKLKILLVYFTIFLPLVGCSSPEIKQKTSKKTADSVVSIEDVRSKLDMNQMQLVFFSIKKTALNKAQFSLIMAVNRANDEQLRKINQPFFYSFSANYANIKFQPVKSSSVQTISEVEVAKMGVNLNNQILEDIGEKYFLIKQQVEG